MARGILKKIKLGIYRGVISKLVLMEMTSALRKAIFGNPEEENPSLDDIQTIIESIILSLLTIKNIELFESKQVLPELELAAFLLMYKFPGEVRNNKYRFLHPLDALHVILAKEAKCDAIYTADRAFNQVKSEIHIKLLGHGNISSQG